MKKHFAIAMLLTMCLAPLGQLSQAQKTEPNFKLRTIEVSRGKALPNIVSESLAASPDQTRVIYATSRLNKGKVALAIIGGLLMAAAGPTAAHGLGQNWGSFRKIQVVVDGVAGKEYENVSTPAFGSDSKHVAYSTGQRVVIDGVESQSYTQVSGPVFSSDGERVAFTTLSGVLSWSKNYGMESIGDGEERKRYRQVNTLSFSTDSEHLMFVVKRKGKWLVVVDEVEGREYEDVRGAIFSKDSQRVTYAAKRNGKWRVVVDGRETQGREYDEIGLKYRFAALTTTAGQIEYRTDDNIGTEGPRDDVEWLSAWGPLFSPDGQRLAYPAKRNGKWLMIVDGVEGPEHGRLWSPVFSPDSKHIIYKARNKGKWRIVRDGVDGKDYNQILNPVFSPDSQHVAYTAKRGDKWVVVVDGVEGPDFERTWGTVFSPDSKRVAYKSMRAGKWRVVIDGVEARGNDYDEIDLSTATFSPDNRHFVYTARRADKWIVVVDGVEGTEYDALLKDKFIFNSPTSFKTIALRNQELFSLEVEIVDPIFKP